jgi:hypothetical protein
VARPEDRPAVFLLVAGIVIGLASLLLPLYRDPMTGDHGWFLAQFPGASTAQTVGFVLPSLGLLALAVAAAIALGAGTSQKVAAGVALALGSLALLTVASRLLLAIGGTVGWRDWTIVGLTALEAVCFLGAGWIAARPAAR